MQGLWAVAIRGDQDELDRVLSAETNVNVQNDMLQTPLHMAAKHGQAVSIAALVKAGASVNVKDKFFNTPVHFAAREGHLDCAKLLVEAGANIDVQNKHGATPIDFCSERDQKAVLEYLVEADGAAASLADANAEAESIECPLGCGESMKRRDAKEHVREACQLSEISCPLLCGLRLPKREMASHRMEPCPNREVPCRLHCGEMIRQGFLDHHEMFLCPINRYVQCRFGCKVLNSHLEKHERSHIRKQLVDYNCEELAFWLSCGPAIGEQAHESGEEPESAKGPKFDFGRALEDYMSVVKRLNVTGRVLAVTPDHYLPTLFRRMGVASEHREQLQNAIVKRLEEEKPRLLPEQEPLSATKSSSAVSSARSEKKGKEGDGEDPGTEEEEEGGPTRPSILGGGEPIVMNVGIGIPHLFQFVGDVLLGSEASLRMTRVMLRQQVPAARKIQYCFVHLDTGRNIVFEHEPVLKARGYGYLLLRPLDPGSAPVF